MSRLKDSDLINILREIQEEIEIEEEKDVKHYLTVLGDRQLIAEARQDEIFKRTAKAIGDTAKDLVQRGKQVLKYGKISAAGWPPENIALLEKEMDAVGMRNQYARIAVIAVIGKESGLVPKSEKTYHNTSLSRIKEIWPWLGKRYSDEEIENLKKATSPSDGHKQPGLALFDVVYGPERPGSTYGNTGPHDGSKYRGRGFNQITWKGTYEKYARLSGVDIVSNPDLLNQPAIAAKVAVKFLVNRLKSGPKEKGLNGTANPNFTNQADANEMLARANAGWGKGGAALARAIASTNKASQKLTTLS